MVDEDEDDEISGHSQWVETSLVQGGCRIVKALGSVAVDLADPYWVLFCCNFLLVDGSGQLVIPSIDKILDCPTFDEFLNNHAVLVEETADTIN